VLASVSSFLLLKVVDVEVMMMSSELLLDNLKYFIRFNIYLVVGCIFFIVSPSLGSDADGADC